MQSLASLMRSFLITFLTFPSCKPDLEEESLKNLGTEFEELSFDIH